MARSARIAVTAAPVLLHKSTGSGAATVFLSVAAGGQTVTLGDGDTGHIAGQGPLIAAGASLPPFLVAEDAVYGRCAAGQTANVDVFVVTAID